MKATLEKAGYFEDKSPHMLSAKYYNKTKKPAVYVRQKGIDSIRYNEMVIQLAKSKGFVTRSDVVELLHVNNAQAYRILNRLVKENRLELSGGRSRS